MPLNSNQRWLSCYIPACILIAATALRALFIFKWHLPEKFLFSDMGIYLRLAQQMTTGPITPEHFFQPIGFPLLESFILNINSNLQPLSWIQLLTSCLTLVFIWKTTVRLTNSYLGLLALAFASFHYPFIFISGTYMSECIFTFLLSFIIWLISCKEYPWKPYWSYAIGIMIGLSLWFKGTFIFYLPLLIIWIAIKNYVLLKKTKNNLKNILTKIKPALILSSGVVTLMLAHGIFSYTNINQFLVSPTNGGLNFMEGKCPWKKNIGPDGRWWLSPLYTQLQQTKEHQWTEPFSNSAFYFNEGVKCIANDPLVLIQSIQSIPYLFINNDFWPSLNTEVKYQNLSLNYNLFFALWLLPALFFALLYSLKKPAENITICWILPILTIFITVIIFKSEIRFRVPFDVVFIPTGIWGWSLILKSIFPDLLNAQHHKAQGLTIAFMALMVVLSLVFS